MLLSPCHQVPCSDILASWGGCSSPLTFVRPVFLHSRKDKKRNAQRGRGGVPTSTAWDPSRPTLWGCQDSPVCTAPTRWDPLLGTRESPRQYGVSLHFRAVLDFCLSSARSWSQPLDLLLPLDRSDLCYSDGETEAGRCHDLTRIRRAESRLCPTSPPCSWSSSPRGPTILGVKSWVSREKRFSLFKGHDYLVNICADNS